MFLSESCIVMYRMKKVKGNTASLFLKIEQSVDEKENFLENRFETKEN